MINTKRQFILRTIGLGVAGALWPIANVIAQASKSARPLRMIIAYPPGGTSDVVGRLIAQGIQQRTGQIAVVENKPGAATMIATDMVARSTPDGSMLSVVTTPFTINPTFQPKLPYDTEKDFVPIILTSTVPLVLVVPANSEIKTLHQFIERIRVGEPVLSYASSGNGGSSHLAGSMFEVATGGKMLHVPYGGSSPAVVSVVGGQTDCLFDTVTVTEPHIKSGKLRALAQTGVARSPLLPDLPTIAENGYPHFDVTSWFVIVAPSATPPELVNKLNAVCNEILKDSKVEEILLIQGLQPKGGTVDEAKRFINSELKKWGKAVKESGATAS